MTTVICKTLQEAETLISEVQKRTQTKYVFSSKTRDFKIENWIPLPGKVKVSFDRTLHKPMIPFTGTPFVFIGSKKLQCHRGRDMNKYRKKKFEEQKMQGYHDKQRRYLIQDSKKVDCPAMVSITRIVTFSDERFLVQKNTEYMKRTSSDLLKHYVNNNRELTWENRYYVYVPHLDEHDGHSTIAEAPASSSESESIDPKVEDKIKQLSRDGKVTNVLKMQKCIKKFVTTTLFKGEEPPHMMNRRYFPFNKDIRSIMNKAQDDALYTRNDKVNMQDFWREFISLFRELPATWKVKDKIFSNHAEKDKAYEELILKLREIDPYATRKTVFSRIKQLRLSFRRELKKVNASWVKSVNGEGHMYKPSFLYYEDLIFLTEDVLETSKSPRKNKKPLKPKKKETEIKKSELLPLACQYCSKPQPQLQVTEDPKDMQIKQWGSIYKNLNPDQTFHARNRINEILYEAQMGILSSYNNY